MLEAVHILQLLNTGIIKAIHSLLLTNVFKMVHNNMLLELLVQTV